MIGHLTGLLTTLKGPPSAYDKDLQEDKGPVFDSYDTLRLLLPVLTGLIRTIKVRPQRMIAMLNPDLLATDLADYLVHKNVPFREAHKLVGKAVRLAEEHGIPLSDLGLQDLQSISSLFKADITQVFNLQDALARRAVEGGTAPDALRKQLDAARNALRTPLTK